MRPHPQQSEAGPRPEEAEPNPLAPAGGDWNKVAEAKAGGDWNTAAEALAEEQHAWDREARPPVDDKWEAAAADDEQDLSSSSAQVRLISCTKQSRLLQVMHRSRPSLQYCNMSSPMLSPAVDKRAWKAVECRGMTLAVLCSPRSSGEPFPWSLWMTAGMARCRPRAATSARSHPETLDH